MNAIIASVHPNASPPAAAAGASCAGDALTSPVDEYGDPDATHPVSRSRKAVAPTKVAERTVVMRSVSPGRRPAGNAGSGWFGHRLCVG